MADALYEIAVLTTAPEGEACINTLHVRHSALGAAASIASDWATDLSVPYRAILPDSYQVEQVSCREIVEHSLPQPAAVVHPIGAPGTRVAIGDKLPAWLTCRATFYSGFAGRRFRGGSSFSGGMQVDVGDEGVLGTSEGAWRPEVELYLFAVQAEYVSHTSKGVWVIFSRKTWHLGGGDSSVWAVDVTAFLTRPRVRSLRSRMVL